MNKIIAIALFIAGLILVGLSGYYIFQIIYFNLWDDVVLRVGSVLTFIGGGVFVAFSRVLKNLAKVIELLKEREEK